MAQSTTSHETASTSSEETPGVDDAQSDAFKAGKSAAHNMTLLYVLGGISIVAGVLIIAMPVVGSITASVATGLVLILSGGIGLVAAFRRRRAWHIAAVFALSLVSAVAGLLMLLQPFAGMLALTTLIAAYFCASGLLRLYYGARSLGDAGGWMIALGLLSLAVGALLWWGLPFNALWVPGLLLGLDLIFWGALQIAFAARAGRGRSSAETT